MSKQKTPTCARCRNHGFIVYLKGHKNFCPFKLCNCAKCYLLLQKQKISATQIAIRRYQESLNNVTNQNQI